MISSMTQDWVKLAEIPLAKRYCTGLPSLNLRWLRTRFYDDNLFLKVEYITRNYFFQISLTVKDFFKIIHFFIKAEVSMLLRYFYKQVVIPNELHFDRDKITSYTVEGLGTFLPLS